jgi:hypothetical protein
MRHLRHAVLAIGVLAISLWSATPATAISITDVVDPADTLIAYGSTPSPCPAGFVCTTSALSFVHDISDDGYVPGVDTITSATIAIHLTDTGGSESYTFTLGASQTFSSVNVPGGSGSTDTIILSLPALTDLAADGKINVTIQSTIGNPGPGEFSFADSVLTAEVTDGRTPPLQVPGPASIALVAAGLAALLWVPRSAKG